MPEGRARRKGNKAQAVRAAGHASPRGARFAYQAVALRPSTHKRLKIEAVNRGITLVVALDEAVELWISKQSAKAGAA